MIDDIYQEGRFVIDLETDSLNVIDANLVGVAICFNTWKSYYIPLQHKNLDGEIIKDQINFEKALKLFKSILGDSSLLKIGHKSKYDIAVLKKYNINVIYVDDKMLIYDVTDDGIHRHNRDKLEKVHSNTC